MNILVKIPYYAVRDIYNYFKNKKWRKYNNTGIYMFGGLFGCGKTLSMVREVVNIYNSYDNIKVYSNVHLKTIPYTKFEYFEQLLEDTPEGFNCIYCIDELGSIMNSRNYKNNKITETNLLLALNQIRHTNKTIFLTTQRFHMADKVFRQVGVAFINCWHLWRFHINTSLDCYDLEYQPNVEPKILGRSFYFADDELYSLYDTKELIYNLKENFENNMSSLEVLPDVDNISVNARTVTRVTKKKLFRR